MHTGEREQLEFQAEARQLLELMIHSIYSNKDIFLRELISNASDALDKLRLEAFRDKDLDADTSDLHIGIDVDEDARTLTVRDNGIGMTRDEVVELIGTIAKLRHRPSCCRKLQRGEGRRGLAGADRPVRRRLLLDASWSPTGHPGDPPGRREPRHPLGVRPARAPTRSRRVDDAPQGTAGDAAPQARGHRGPAARLHGRAEDPRDRQALLRLHRLADPDGRSSAPTTEGGEPTSRRAETLNSMKALWARPARRGHDEEYNEFYRHVSHDWTDPLEIIHMKAEGTFEYEALLFIPSRAPFDLFSRDGRRGVQLYVKRVFIMDDCEALMPEYLRFVKGVVDAQDLSLNVSREILQQDRQIQIDPAPAGQEGARHAQGDEGDRRREVPHVLGRVRPRAQGGPARRHRQPRRACSRSASFASTHDADELDHARRVRRADEGRPGADLLHDRRVAGQLENSPAHGGVPGQGATRCCC